MDTPEHSVSVRCVTSGATLTLSVEPGDSFFFFVALSHPTLSCVARAWSYRPESIPELFRFMAEHWRGWEGVRSAASLEGEVLLEARSSPAGAITVTLTLENRVSGLNEPPAWRITYPLTIEPGSLDGLARSVEGFFAPVLAAAAAARGG